MGELERVSMVLNERWRLDALLGSGAMGSVYRARDLVLDRPVAVKLLSEALLGDASMTARFRREAMASSRLVHPNIVTTLDFGIHEQVPFIVMELVDGRGLDSILEGGRRMSAARVAHLGRGIALALAAAHRHSIVHRDIKPGNVMVTEGTDGEVARLVDFGIAQARAVGPRLTMVGIAVGTPGYMSPEQLSGQEVGAAADIFSLGVTMYEMLAGTLPWLAQDPMRLMVAVLRDPPEPLQLVRPDIPPGLAALVMQMIQAQPGDRIETAQAVADALAPYASDDVDELELAKARSVMLAAASLDARRSIGDRQLRWFTKSVEEEGGRVAQTIGREAVAVLPSAEATLRLTRGTPPADVPRPPLAFHVGDVATDDTGLMLGGGVRAVLRLARLAGGEEVLLTQELHDAVGLGWRGRLQHRGRFVLDTNLRCEVFALRGQESELEEMATLEMHPNGLHWRCVCGSHGPVPTRSAKRMRVRCSVCSRLLLVDTQQPAAEVSTEGHPLTSIVLAASTPDLDAERSVDQQLLDALTDFGE